MCMCSFNNNNNVFTIQVRKKPWPWLQTSSSSLQMLLFLHCCPGFHVIRLPTFLFNFERSKQSLILKNWGVAGTVRLPLRVKIMDWFLGVVRTLLVGVRAESQASVGTVELTILEAAGKLCCGSKGIRPMGPHDSLDWNRTKQNTSGVRVTGMSSGYLGGVRTWLSFSGLMMVDHTPVFLLFSHFIQVLK